MDGLGSNTDASSEELEQRKKRRKLTHEKRSSALNDAVWSPNQGRTERARWRTDAEQQIYSSKLLEALRRSRRRNSPMAKGREVRETADRVLATAAKGATRWSRAILASRLRLRVRKVKKAKKVIGESRLTRMQVEREKKRKLPPVERKLRDLSRLIPGCRKAPLPSLLEETSDYIAALEMQIKAIAQILAASGGGDGGGAAPVNSAR